jgi:hypothetical protein
MKMPEPCSLDMSPMDSLDSRRKEDSDVELPKEILQKLKLIEKAFK